MPPDHVAKNTQLAKNTQRTAHAPRKSIPVVMLSNWLRAAARFGIPIEPLFAEVGIQVDPAQPEMATMQPDSMWRLMQICVVEAQRREQATSTGEFGALDEPRHFPFVLGETFAFKYLTDVETFITTSSTLRAALKVIEWVQVLIDMPFTTQLVEGGEWAELVLHPIQTEEQTRWPGTEQYFVEAFVAALMKFARSLWSGPLPFNRIELALPPPAYARRYAQAFEFPVLFGQPKHRIVFSQALLDQPLKGAFPSLHSQAELRVAQQLAQLPQEQELVLAMTRAWDEAPQLLAQPLKAMAQSLGLHERSLQRRLHELGQHYRQLQAQHRYRMASLWLSEGELSVTEISIRLGYTERRSFSDAFKKWSGRSPSKFKRP